jgi:glucosamine-6-phosphate deaminase
MQLRICRDRTELGKLAAANAATCIGRALADRGIAHVVFATGNSQLEMLSALVAAGGVDWNKVVGFHLDEYVGLSASHPASFRRYLTERVVSRLPFRAFHLIDGEADPHAECRRLGELIRAYPIDLTLMGIGENGHLAFNDPPADFLTEKPYHVVDLDDDCRRQQVGEGWFPSLDDVPKKAISMSIRQIMKSSALIGCVPDRRKAHAVRRALEGGVSPQVPASILQQHDRTVLYLDPPATELISAETRRKYGAD